MKRRDFIKVASTTVSGMLGTVVTPSAAAMQAAKRPNLAALSPVDPIPNNEQRNWLGKAYWGNRLQDWQVNNGRIECLRAEASFEVRTVALLTRALNNAHKPARLRMHLGNLTPSKNGFCGFLLGIGAGKLDYRASALAQRYGGENGGFMAVIDSTGELSFRDFSNQNKPIAYEQLQRTTHSQTKKPLADKEIILDCHIDPTDQATFDVRLIASDAKTGEELGFIVRTQVPASELLGGIAMLSSPPAKQAGARWWFNRIETGGEKISINEEHALGPVMGCLYSLNKSVLKLTAQFLPIANPHKKHVRLEYKAAKDATWQQGQTKPIEEGYVACFRLSKWDFSQAYEYRIVFTDAPNTALFCGTIVKDHQSSKQLNIALYSCIIPTAKSLDRDVYEKLIPQEAILGRYTPDNILFPHNKLVTHCDSHAPDLYVFAGDQYYETYPTRYGRDTPDAKLDTLYRWYLWFWTFRDSVRHRPAIVIADDHDVLQGNLWGNGGKDSSDNTEEGGGFSWAKDLVRMVYRIQHSHNPDAFDPTPIKHDIPVTYGEFEYGGVSFAVIEDRKFKTPPNTEVDPLLTKGELLGKRQEDFLKHWSENKTHLPKICLTASMWGSPQTKGNAEPLLDYDANGYPPDGRTRAVSLVKRANALVLAGDQHLAMVAKQGVNDFEDGALFFAGPAAAAFWQRWFEGEGKLENKRNNHPNTGNFIDTFGNKMRVLAVANPKLTYAEFKASNKHWGNFVADHRLKSEGYGIVKVDHTKKQYTLECWPWDVDPNTGAQFEGWPFVQKWQDR